MVFLEVIWKQSQRTTCCCFKCGTGGSLIHCMQTFCLLLQLVWNAGFPFQLHEWWATAAEDTLEHHGQLSPCGICLQQGMDCTESSFTQSSLPQSIYVPGHSKNVPGAAGGWPWGLQVRCCCSSGVEELTWSSAWCRSCCACSSATAVCFHGILILFILCSPYCTYLGDRCVRSLISSSLPYEIVAAFWQLSDKDKRGEENFKHMEICRDPRLTPSKEIIECIVRGIS